MHSGRDRHAAGRDSIQKLTRYLRVVLRIAARDRQAGFQRIERDEQHQRSDHQRDRGGLNAASDFERIQFSISTLAMMMNGTLAK